MSADNTFDHAAINRIIHEPVRLGIMTLLASGYAADFTYLKGALQVSDGNLAAHLRTLEEAGYVQSQKEFYGRKPRTLYSATESGQSAYHSYVKTVRKLLAT